MASSTLIDTFISRTALSYPDEPKTKTNQIISKLSSDHRAINYEKISDQSFTSFSKYNYSPCEKFMVACSLVIIFNEKVDKNKPLKTLKNTLFYLICHQSVYDIRLYRWRTPPVCKIRSGFHLYLLRESYVTSAKTTLATRKKTNKLKLCSYLLASRESTSGWCRAVGHQESQGKRKSYKKFWNAKVLWRFLSCGNAGLGLNFGLLLRLALESNLKMLCFVEGRISGIAAFLFSFYFVIC